MAPTYNAHHRNSVLPVLFLSSFFTTAYCNKDELCYLRLWFETGKEVGQIPDAGLRCAASHPFLPYDNRNRVQLLTNASLSSTTHTATTCLANLLDYH